MNSKQITISIALASILAIFAIFVWPTRYRYDHTVNQFLVRIDRFTDEVSYLDMRDGWKILKQEEQKAIFTLPEPSPSHSPYQIQLPDAPLPTSTRQSK